MNEDAQILLVNNQHGIYTYHVLATNFPLFVSDGFVTNSNYIPLKEWLAHREDMANETIETAFHPDNEESVENIEYCAYHNILAVQNEKTGDFWRVESIDGDIWAINPHAEYDEELETYVLTRGKL